MSSKQDTRTFLFVGTATDPGPDGATKVRFTTSVSHGERMKKLGYANINLVELPERMTKTAAIAYLLANEPVGVDLNVLSAKQTAITEQTARANGEGTGRKRGRPAKEKSAAEIEAAKAVIQAKVEKKAARELARLDKAREVAERKAAKVAAKATKAKVTKPETIATAVVKAAKARSKTPKVSASATE